MKKNIPFLLIILIMFTSCATKIPFDQTCLNCIKSQRISCKDDDCPQIIMVGTDCIAIIEETGEKINMNYILFQESKDAFFPVPVPITLAKIRGRYFVTGANFKNLWILTPRENEAIVKSIAFPQNRIDAAPIFEISNNNLLVKDEKNTYSYLYDIDTKKWVILSTRAGG